MARLPPTAAISVMVSAMMITGAIGLAADSVPVIPPSVTPNVLVTKEWEIPPDLVPRAAAASVLASGAAAADAVQGVTGNVDRAFAKDWLIANGVAFDGAARAIYIFRTTRLIVRNTQDQLDLVEAIINRFSEATLVSNQMSLE